MAEQAVAQKRQEPQSVHRRGRALLGSPKEDWDSPSAHELNRSLQIEMIAWTFYHGIGQHLLNVILQKAFLDEKSPASFP